MIIIIQNIYETHLHVRNLEKAINFYQKQARINVSKKTLQKKSGFLFGSEKNKQQMLGLWEVHNIEDFEPRHFCFWCKFRVFNDF